MATVLCASAKNRIPIRSSVPPLTQYFTQLLSVLLSVSRGNENGVHYTGLFKMNTVKWV